MAPLGYWERLEADVLEAKRRVEFELSRECRDWLAYKEAAAQERRAINALLYPQSWPPAWLGWPL